MSFFVKNGGRRWFSILSALLVAVAALQTVIYLFCYDQSLGLYEQGFPTDLVKLGYLLIALLICSSTAFLPLYLIKKNAPDCLPLECKQTDSSAIDFLSLLTAASIAASLITQIVMRYTDDPLSVLLLSPADANRTAHTMLLASLVLALPATLYFIGIFTRKISPYSLLLTILWVCAYLLRVYFDTSVLLMSPLRQMTILGLSATIFFLLAELRLVKGRPSYILYSIAATLTALFAGTSGSSALLMTALGRCSVTVETGYYAFQLLIALFALFRLKAVLTPIFAAFEKAHPATDHTDKPADPSSEEEAV